MLWTILTIVAVIGLVTHLRGPNAVWGTATLGIPIGLVIAFFQTEWDWWIVGKAVVVAAIIGLALELMGKLTERNA
ncbi:MAG: hypothetical protein AAF291_15095 [Pseudomonadota bacterium]